VSQIAFQTAFHRYTVTVYDISDEISEQAKPTIKKLGETYTTDLSALKEQIEET
jgi:3-hydroxyacyl-CoA dehydrogenase